MTSPPPADPARWAIYEAETERRMRQAIGDELYEWLEKMEKEESDGKERDTVH